MPAYRLYFMGVVGGHIESFREFEADEDGEAIDTCERWRGDGPMELWCRSRKVDQWETLLAPANRATG